MYTRREVEKIVGMTPVQIRTAGDQGLLSLDQQYPGRGNARLYTWLNLLELAIIKELRKNRIELAKIRNIMHNLKGKIGTSKEVYSTCDDLLPGHLQDRSIRLITITQKEIEYSPFIPTADGLGLTNRTKDSYRDCRRFVEIPRNVNSGIFVDINKIALELPE